MKNNDKEKDPCACAKQDIKAAKKAAKLEAKAERRIMKMEARAEKKAQKAERRAEKAEEKAEKILKKAAKGKELLNILVEKKGFLPYFEDLSELIEKEYKVKGGKKLDLKAFSCEKPEEAPRKKHIRNIILPYNIVQMQDMQRRLYAEDSRSLLLVFQAPDTAGKDGVIRHVLSGLNPQGCKVTPFKQPSAEELDHDYLYRIHKALPPRGEIGVFNRSHYEEVLVAKVHDLPSKAQKLHPAQLTGDIWERRYKDICNFEDYLAHNGTKTIKIYLHIDFDEQRRRLIDRIDRAEKNFKFSQADIRERALWSDYRKAYEAAMAATSTEDSPWYAVPANDKWYARLVVSQLILDNLRAMNPQYPESEPDFADRLQEYKQSLLADAEI